MILEWPDLNKHTSLQYRMCSQKDPWRKLSNFRTVWNALFGNDGAENHFFNADKYFQGQAVPGKYKKRLSDRGKPYFVILWDPDDYWALLTDGQKVGLLDKSSTDIIESEVKNSGDHSTLVNKWLQRAQQVKTLSQLKHGQTQTDRAEDDKSSLVRHQSQVMEQKSAPLPNRFPDQQKRLMEYEERINALELENARLRELYQPERFQWSNIADETLREHLEPLQHARWDTIMREAGVVLEDRLRSISGLDDSKFGVGLVDAAFSPENGVLQLRPHKGEQDGLRMLFRGAMQFIRNPAMHRLIEYEEETAYLLVSMIDALLRLLSETDRARQPK